MTAGYHCALLDDGREGVVAPIVDESGVEVGTVTWVRQGDTFIADDWPDLPPGRYTVLNDKVVLTNDDGEWFRVMDNMPLTIEHAQ